MQKKTFELSFLLCNYNCYSVILKMLKKRKEKKIFCFIVHI